MGHGASDSTGRSTSKNRILHANLAFVVVSTLTRPDGIIPHNRGQLIYCFPVFNILYKNTRLFYTGPQKN